MGFFSRKKVQASEGYIYPIADVVSNFFNTAVTSYESYDTQVRETKKKYMGYSSLGGFQARQIIDTTAALVAGDGVTVKVEGDKEQEFVRKFKEFNSLDKLVFELAKEFLMEGKQLIYLSPAGNEMVNVRYIPYIDISVTNRGMTYGQAYWIYTNDGDYENPTKIEIFNSVIDGKKEFSGNDLENFVFSKFGGTLTSVNVTPTRIGLILSKIDAFDSALKDWREINNKIASPTPTYEFDDDQALVDFANTYFPANSSGNREAKIKIGDVVLIRGRHHMVETNGGGVSSIKEEMTMLARVISGSTGISADVFGFPDLMSNRATSDNISRILISILNANKTNFEYKIAEIIKKSMKIAGSGFKQENIDNLRVFLPTLNPAYVEQLKDFWLELFKAGAISEETLLERIPGIDVEQELERLKNQITVQPNVSTGMPGA